MSPIDLQVHGIHVEDIRRNLTPSQLYEEAIRHDAGTRIADSGALVAYSGAKTGRSPMDKRIVRRPESAPDVWWSGGNVPLEPQVFAINRERAIDYLNTRSRIYCFDGFAGWDPAHQIKVRVLCSRPYHVLPVSSLIKGAYGLHDVCLSVPTEVGCGGARKQIELPLTPKERLGMQNSGRVLRETIEAVKNRLAGGETKTGATSPLPGPKGRTIPRGAWQTK